MSENVGPRALVTGGGRRIGAAIVRRLAENGFAVWIHVRRSRREAEALRESLPSPGRHIVSVCDLSDPAARGAWLETLPGFDLVVNNASCYRLTPPGETESAADRERYREVNLEAPLAVIRHQFDHLAGEGLAVNLLDADILDEAGGVEAPRRVPAGEDSYLATRKALGMATRMLARELAPRLRVNGIAPGPVLPPAGIAGAGMTRILDRVPLRRPVAVEAVVNTVEFLWRNRDLTGAVIPVDGGMSTPR